MKTFCIKILFLCFGCVPFAFGQRECIQELRSIQSGYSSKLHGGEASYIIRNCDGLIQNSSEKKCLKSPSYILELASYYEKVLELPDTDTAQFNHAINQVLLLYHTAGSLDSTYISEGGDAALSLMELYRSLSLVYYNLGDGEMSAFYQDSAIFWAKIHHPEIAPNPSIQEEQGVKTTVKPQDVNKVPTSHSVFDKFTLKPLVVCADTSHNYEPLIDSLLQIESYPDCELVPSDNPARFRYFFNLKNDIRYRFTVRYPGYESQYVETWASQVRAGDTIRIVMIREGTPYYYRLWRKVSFSPDSSSILILRNRFGSLQEFDLLIDSLNLVRANDYSLNYHKVGNVKFNMDSDSALMVLRQNPLLVEAAGYSLGSRNEFVVLTNQGSVVWEKKRDDWTVEEKLEFEQVTEKYHLKFTDLERFNADPGIGFALIDIIEALNELSTIRYAYPILFELLSQHN